jgi:hypothetical protein
LHALEGVDLLDRDRVIVGTTGLLEEEFVLEEVGVGEVELDLFPNLVWVAALWQVVVL